MLHDQRFQRFSLFATRKKLKDELLPLFSHFSEEGTVVDLQDVFRRFTFDTAMITIGGSDTRSLSAQMASDEFVKALEDVEVAIVYRHMMPRFMWKLQNCLGQGQEKKMIEADAIFERLCGKYVSDKRDEIRKEANHHYNNGEFVDLLTFFIKFSLLDPIDDKLLRDVIVGFILAARDTIASTLSWFFWLLSENPQVVTKIHDEIQENLPRSRNGQERPAYDTSELDKLVYLHGALCESMRLYPPVPFQRRSAIKQDVLPSGHKVDANATIVYAMGKMKAVWGEGALEFKPERWVSPTGGIRHEPSYKFFAFNAGPRTCLGRNMAMTQLKTVVVEVLQNYDIEVVKGQKIEPFSGLILHMKHGLKVKFNKRS